MPPRRCENIKRAASPRSSSETFGPSGSRRRAVAAARRAARAIVAPVNAVAGRDGLEIGGIGERRRQRPGPQLDALAKRRARDIELESSGTACASHAGREPSVSTIGTSRPSVPSMIALTSARGTSSRIVAPPSRIAAASRSAASRSAAATRSPTRPSATMPARSMRSDRRPEAPRIASTARARPEPSGPASKSRAGPRRGSSARMICSSRSRGMMMLSTGCGVPWRTKPRTSSSIVSWPRRNDDDAIGEPSERASWPLRRPPRRARRLRDGATARRRRTASARDPRSAGSPAPIRRVMKPTSARLRVKSSTANV